MAFPDRDQSPVELNHEKAYALTRKFKDTLEFIHDLLADMPQDREKAVRHARRLKGYGEDSMIQKDLAALSDQMLIMFKLSLMVPPGFYMELTVTPRRFNAYDFRDSGYLVKDTLSDSVRHCVNVGLPHQDADVIKQLVFDIDVPIGGFPSFVLRETLNHRRGQDRHIGVDDLLGVKVRFPARK